MKRAFQQVLGTLREVQQELDERYDRAPDAKQTSWMGRLIPKIAFAILALERGEHGGENASTRSAIADQEVASQRMRLLEATLKLIAYPELQNEYTAKQLARHALRIEPLPKRAATEHDIPARA
jgi:hypothetical protein